ncbi:hypothetical protein RFI_34672, partial [Reticulomyxa filosa]
MQSVRSSQSIVAASRSLPSSSSSSSWMESSHRVTRKISDLHAMPTLSMSFLRYKMYLISGAGALQNDLEECKEGNKEHNDDDSTELLSEILQRFIEQNYSNVEVIPFDSGKEIFRYTENVRFVHQELRPTIDRELSYLATHFGNRWKKYFHLSLALCDGAPARLSALTEGLRPFEPDMLHVVNLKTLWSKLFVKKIHLIICKSKCNCIYMHIYIYVY